MKPSLSGRSSLVAALLLGVTACSVTDYQQPITKFASATKNAETALDALNTKVTTDYSNLLKQQAMAGEVLVEVVPGDCVLASAHCRLQLLDRDEQTQSLTPPPALGNMAALMASITAYANNLVALVSADTAAAVAASVDATLGSVENLAETVEKADGTKQPVDLSAYNAPVGEAVTWIVGQYVASVKLDGLRRATKEAQPVIAQASAVFEKAAAIAANVPKDAMAQEVSQKLAAFDTSPTQQNLDRLITSADQFNQLLEARPADVFAQMSTAHQALTEQLQGSGVSMAEVIARIEKFAAEAETLAKIARTFAAAKTGT